MGLAGKTQPVSRFWLIGEQPPAPERNLPLRSSPLLLFTFDLLVQNDSLKPLLDGCLPRKAMIINNAAQHKEPSGASFIFILLLSYTQSHVYLCGLNLIQSYLSKIYFWKFLNQGGTSQGCYV